MTHVFMRGVVKTRRPLFVFFVGVRSLLLAEIHSRAMATRTVAYNDAWKWWWPMSEAFWR